MKTATRKQQQSCMFTAFGSLACTAPKNKRPRAPVGDIRIVPFKDVPEHVKESICTSLLAQWGPEYQRHGVDTPDKLCTRIAGTSNELFVGIIDTNGEEDVTWVGVIGIDPSGNYGLPIRVPCVNHLYVLKQYRHMGYGKILLAHVDNMSIKRGYKTIALWCEPHLRSYYRRKGWTQMSGNLVPANLDTPSKLLPTVSDGEYASSSSASSSSAPGESMMIFPSTKFKSIYIMAKSYHPSS